MVNGFAFALSLLLSLNAWAQAPLQKIAFGSCNHQTDLQPLWKDLILESPELFIWGGDNIYADTTDPALIKAAYDIQNRNVDYQHFKTLTKIIGTWDDHDFAFNNATGIYSGKSASQNHFLDFIGEPVLSPRRFRHGIYTSYEYGPREKKVKVILLDNRFFKDIEPGAPMLGEEQWKWLEREVRTSTAELNIIVAGLSMLSPKLMISDEFADYPGELERFLTILNQNRGKRFLMLSGDKHFSSIFKRHGHLEFMSSGMTHTLKRGLRAYVGNKYPNTFYGLNYGMIEIDWKENVPSLTMAIRNRHGESFFKKNFHWENNEWLEK